MFFKRLTKEKRPPQPAAETAEPPDPSTALPALLSRTEAQALAAKALRRSVNADALGFKSTAELTPADGLIGQARAFEAIDFGLGMKAHGFNIFVLGPAASGKRTAVRAHVAKMAAASARPSDWVYVPRFDDPRRPKALALPAGRAEALARGVRAAVDELIETLPAAFRSEEYRARRRAIEEELLTSQDDALAAIHAKAAQQNIAVLRTPLGYSMAPTHDGKVVKPDVFNQLPSTMRRDVETRIAALEKELEEVLARAPQAERHRRQQLAALNQDAARHAVEDALDGLSRAFQDLPETAAFIAELEADLVVHGEQLAGIETARGAPGAHDFAGRYGVTVMAAQPEDAAGAPVCGLTDFSLSALVGCIAHVGRDATVPVLVPGALHKANGGALLVDGRSLVKVPAAWDGLKHALKACEIRPVAAAGAAQPASPLIEPDPIPLAAKIVMFGDADLFQQLEASDPDFARLFKVQADFEETIARSDENDRAYASQIASIAALDGLKAIDAEGVARLMEEASRLAENRDRLTLELGRIADIMQEADHWSGEAGRSATTAKDVRRALDERLRRSDRTRTQVLDAIERGVLLIDTAGVKIGQINALSLAQKTGCNIARPVRITARAHLGKGRVTDIEREAALGGALHSKGVMILWGYLAGRFAETIPLALAATLVFEQSYDAVDGDSAAAAELFALLSALAEAPLRQEIAVTGSLNQWGEIQAVGGINEKIEGYFDVCAARGLTGTQGVMIPDANRQHLMLREDVVAAVRDGRFHVYAIKTADEGIALMTGLEAGQKGADGFAPPTLNGRVAARLASFAERARAFSAGAAA